MLDFLLMWGFHDKQEIYELGLLGDLTLIDLKIIFFLISKQTRDKKLQNDILVVCIN